MMNSMSKTLREAVNKSGLSLCAINRETGVNLDSLSRFMRGTSLRLDKADLLAEFFGLELREAAQTKRRKGQSNGKRGK